MVGLFYKAVAVFADEDKIGGSAILRLVPAHEVTGASAPVVASRRQLGPRGALKIGFLYAER